MISKLLTGVASCDHLLQNLVLECSQHGLHNDIVVGFRGESDQGGGGGCAWKTHLERREQDNDNQPLEAN